MKTTERILWVMVCIGLLLKVGRLPMSGFLLILGLSLLSMLYFLLSWLLFPKPERKDQVLLWSILTGVALSIGLTGILFKLQLWPMSSLYLALGSISLLMLVAAVLVVRPKHPHLASYFKGLLIRMLPVLVVCAMLYSLPSGTLMEYYYRGDPEMSALMVRMNASTDPADREAIRVQVDSLLQVRAMRSAGY